MSWDIGWKFMDVGKLVICTKFLFYRNFIPVLNANLIYPKFLCKTYAQNNDKTLIFLENVSLPNNKSGIANQAKEKNGFLTNLYRSDRNAR